MQVCDWRTVQSPDSLKLCGDSQIQGAGGSWNGAWMGGAAGSCVSDWARRPPPPSTRGRLQLQLDWADLKRGLSESESEGLSLRARRVSLFDMR